MKLTLWRVLKRALLAGTIGLFCCGLYTACEVDDDSSDDDDDNDRHSEEVVN